MRTGNVRLLNLFAQNKRPWLQVDTLRMIAPLLPRHTASDSVDAQITLPQRTVAPTNGDSIGGTAPPQQWRQQPLPPNMGRGSASTNTLLPSVQALCWRGGNQDEQSFGWWGLLAEEAMAPCGNDPLLFVAAAQTGSKPVPTATPQGGGQPHTIMSAPSHTLPQCLAIHGGAKTRRPPPLLTPQASGPKLTQQGLDPTLLQ